MSRIKNRPRRRALRPRRRGNRITETKIKERMAGTSETRAKSLKRARFQRMSGTKTSCFYRRERSNATCGSTSARFARSVTATGIY